MTNEKTLELVEKAIAGDREAVAAICEEKGKKILYTAAGMMGNMQDGEEVMQEVLIKVYQKIGALREPKFFDLWLYRVVLNECNRQRKKRMQRYEDIQIAEEQLNSIREERAEFLPPEFAENNEKRQMLLDVIKGLRPNYRAVVLLFYFDGMNYEQITKIMGISTHMVDNYLRGARKKIRAELEKGLNTRFDNMLAAAPVPVLTRAMAIDADETIAAQTINRSVLKAENSHTRFVRTGARVSAVVTKLVAGVSAVALVAGIGMTNAKSLPAQESPLSSSAMEAPDAPQPPGLPVAEGGLEINESSSPLTGSTPQSEPANYGEAAPARQVQGALAIEDCAGNIVNNENTQKYISNVTVRLLDGGGTVAAQTVTDAQGKFDFQENTAGDGYTVQVEMTDTLLAPANETPGGIYPLGGTGENGEVLLRVRKAFDPRMKIVLTGGDCECGHVNPQKAEVVCADSLNVPRRWEIWSKEGELVAQGGAEDPENTEAIGESARITADETGPDTADEGARTVEEAFQNLPEGAYTLEWWVEDVAGNTAMAKHDFRIVNGPVDPEAYK